MTRTNTISAASPSASRNGSGLIFFGLLLVALALVAGPLMDRLWPVHRDHSSQAASLSGHVTTGGTLQIMPYQGQPLQIELINKASR